MTRRSMIALTAALLALGCSNAGSVTPVGWTVVERRNLTVGSDQGKSTLSYHVEHPPRWSAKESGSRFYTSPPGERQTSFMVGLIHKGDAGAEQLLNQPGGLKLWVARRQPGLRLVRTLTVTVGTERREVLEYRGTTRQVEVLQLIALVRSGDVNILLMAECAKANEARQRSLLEDAFRRFRVL